MNELKNYFVQELPYIEDFLIRETDKLDGLIKDVAKHTLLGSGKRIRPILTIVTARCLGYAKGDVYPLASALELLHSATLIHDDILDGAELRRGKTAAHLAFGIKETILAGDALLALANMLGAGYGVPKINEYLARGIMETAEGEILEIAWMDEPSLDRERYLEIVTGKTACLIRTACQCGAVLAGAEQRLEDAARDFGLNMGIAFQLVDDALDYVSDPGHTGKHAGGDLDEGKITLPLILFLEELDQGEREQYFAKIKNHDLSPKEKTWILGQVKKLGCAVRTREVAGEYADKARGALELFPDNPERKVLAQALDFVLTRHK